MMKFSRSLFAVRHLNNCIELPNKTRIFSNKELHLKIYSMQVSILKLRKDLEDLHYKDNIKQLNDTDVGTIEDCIENYWKIGG